MYVRPILVMLASMALTLPHLTAVPTHSKTHLASRTMLDQLPLEYATYHHNVYGPRNEKHKTTLQVAGFYQETTNDKTVGSTFGSKDDCASFAIKKAQPARSSDPVLLSSWFIHNINDEATRKKEMLLLFKPTQKIAGARFDLTHELDNFFKHCFFQMSLPVMYIEHDLKDPFCESEPAKTCEDLSLANFFQGSFSSTDAENAQEALKRLKISSSMDTMGVGDIHFGFGYKICRKEKRQLAVKAILEVPTGRKPHGEFLFEPVYGNGGHFGLGCGIDGAVQMWHNDCSIIRLIGAARHKYLFEATEIRTPGIKNYPLGHYYLAGKLYAGAPTTLQPAANIITQPMRVKPGHHLEALLAGSFTCCNFIADAGYNVFWKDRENAWIKRWKDNVYGIAPQDFNTKTNRLVPASQEPKNADDKAATLIINRDSFDTSMVEMPMLWSHTLFASLGYNMTFRKTTTLFVGIGGSYEFGANDATFDRYSLWAKAGISF